jgi:hypothetical protein
MRKNLMLILTAAAAAGCGGVQSRVHGGRVDGVIDQRPDRGSYVESIGIGASDPKLVSDTQKKSLARDAAIVKAQYEMLSMVKGVTLSGGISVSMAMEKDSTLEAKMVEAIKGAEILKSEFTEDSGCVVTLRLSKDRLEDMMGVRFQ